MAAAATEMAVAGTGGGGGILLPFRFMRRRQQCVLAAGFRKRAAARAGISSAVSTGSSSLDDRKTCNCMSTLSCPICHKPFKSKNGSNLTSLECEACKKVYNRDEAYYDLTIASSSEDFAEAKPRPTELFRSPLISFLYERGWRQSFVWGGFPGAEKEFEMAKENLKPAYGGTIVDASCGSGLFSRLFSKSGLYKCVVALDFSENMLKQCSEFAKQEGISRESLVIVRADIARLPFQSNSIDAIHAGAALHCWPSPSIAVAEISRVLRPGGSFVASTYLADGLLTVFPFSLGPQVIRDVTGQYVAKSERELEDLFKACGFVDFTVLMRNRLFIMMAATKPS